MKNITIIGAGLGGLTAGALLAKEGHKVTILEQHNIVGGCATTFKRGDFICEVGLHKMDGVYTNPTVVDIFKRLGVYEHIEFIKPNEFFSLRTKRGEFIMPNGVDEAKKALIEKFPKEKKGVESYFKTIGKIKKSLETLQNPSWYHYALFPFLFWDILLYRTKNVTTVLDKMTENKELKLILNANVQYYNDTPNTLSFLLHAVAQGSYYQGGGWFIKGGSGKLSNYLAKVIIDNGGEVITKATVTSCQQNGVTYTHKKEVKSIKSDITISNLSPKQTYEFYQTPYQESKEIGNSLLTIYLGFNKNLKQVYGKRAYSNFIFDDIASVAEFNNYLKKDIFKRGFIFVDYSQIDSGLTKESKSFGAVCSVDYIDEWRDLNRDEYKRRKERLINSTLKKMERYYPNISELVEYVEVGTPKTVERYIKTPNGTAYGFKPTPKEFFRVPKVKSDKIDNLYFVGQWVIAGGFSPAIVSGKLCFDMISQY